MATTFNIRRCEKPDLFRVKSLLSKNTLIHRHLDWRDPLDWLESQYSYLSTNARNAVNGYFCCAPEIANYFWVRIFACRNKDELFPLWNAMVNRLRSETESAYQEQKLFCLAYYSWMIQLLELEGWKTIEHIVQLEWQPAGRMDLPETLINSHIQKMRKPHIESAFDIDHQSFQKVWQQSLRTFTLSYKQAGYATVYEENAKIIGFQISTIKNRHAHLARIAVHPDFRRNRIGEFLLIDFLNYCKKRDISKISVNTQKSNISSIALYQKWGFIDQGEPFPLLSLE